jgi:ribulose kinase
MSRRTIVAFLLVACLLGSAMMATVAEVPSSDGLHKARSLAEAQINPIKGNRRLLDATVGGGRKLLGYWYKCHWYKCHWYKWC